MLDIPLLSSTIEVNRCQVVLSPKVHTNDSLAVNIARILLFHNIDVLQLTCLVTLIPPCPLDDEPVNLQFKGKQHIIDHDLFHILSNSGVRRMEVLTKDLWSTLSDCSLFINSRIQAVRCCSGMLVRGMCGWPLQGFEVVSFHEHAP